MMHQAIANESMATIMCTHTRGNRHTCTLKHTLKYDNIHKTQSCTHTQTHPFSSWTRVCVCVCLWMCMVSTMPAPRNIHTHPHTHRDTHASKHAHTHMEVFLECCGCSRHARHESTSSVPGQCVWRGSMRVWLPCTGLCTNLYRKLQTGQSPVLKVGPWR